MTYPPAHVSKAALRILRQERAQLLGTIQIKLTVIEIALTTLEEVFAHDKGRSRHLAKVRRWLEECWQSVGQGTGLRLSAEVQRRADRESALVDEARRSVVGPCDTPDAWAAWLVAIDALLQDVAVSLVKPPRCWRYLPRTWETLARLFLAHVDAPRAEANGTAIYLATLERTGWE